MSIAAQQFYRMGAREAGDFLPSIAKWPEIYGNGTPCAETIVRALKNMGSKDVLLFYIRPQNAALLVRNQWDGAIFECFEVLPTTGAVMSAKDALIRQFPARAIFLPKEVLNEEDFILELGTAIHKLSIEQLRLAMETSTKGQNTVAEERQSVHPRAVTEWLFAILSSRGELANTLTVHKRTHDDVCWKGTDKPWRRSGVYLSARVAFQTVFHNSAAADIRHSFYKNYMLFLLCRLTNAILAVMTTPDVLHVMRVKLARRNAKLGSATLPFVQQSVHQTLRRLNEAMQIQWQQVIAQEDSPMLPIPVADVSPELTLKNSRSTLQDIWQRSKTSCSYSVKSFSPKACTSVQLDRRNLPSPGVFGESGDLLSCLVGVEKWVADNLTPWSVVNKTRDSCTTLAAFLKAYHTSAHSKYKDHPERTSVMLLTMFELWVALDTIVTHLQPLLLQYPPEMDTNVFWPLLLHSKSELERLARVESHISRRRDRCETVCPSMFSDPSPICFAVRFYDQSEGHVKLCTQIETEAQSAREAKEAEWNSSKARFEELLRDVAGREHGVYIIPHGRRAGTSTHCRYCTRCRLEKEAHSIKIAKHEWPLPEDETIKKAVIFELTPPEEIIRWRDITWYLVHDIARSDVRGCRLLQQLLSYPPLHRHAQHQARRVTLASAVKPMHRAHFFKAGLHIDEIFVKNGMHMQMNDSAKGFVWTAEQTQTPQLHKHCTSKLPAAKGSHLAEYVNGTSHTQNMVIASQSSCSPDMSQHEHLLFGSLRSGERLQFINILGAIKSCEIDLNSSDVSLLFLHATSQVGNPADTRSRFLRESQLDLANSSFCHSLLEAISSRFATIEANWKEATAAMVFLRLISKMLSMKPDMAEECMDLLLRIRQASLDWVRQLADLHTEKRGTADAGASLTDISRQIVKCCILMRRTYAVYEDLLTPRWTESICVEDYVEVSIHLHNHLNRRSIDNAEVTLRYDILNDEYVARSLQAQLLELLQVDDGRFSRGIQRFWPSATFEGDWRIVIERDASWIENRCRSRSVHFNLITGSLLVSGQPLSQLPTQYRDNPLYRSIFGGLDLDVFTADVNDMEYMSRTLFEGHRVYLRLHNGNMLIRSQHGDDKYEAVPKDIFLGDLPKSTLKDSIPWMCLGDGTIAFRSTSHPWKSLPADWVLHLNVGTRSTTTMRTDQAFLIDHASALGSAICSIFQALEEKDHILISKCQGTTIEIWLPRFRLHFYVNYAGELQCRELSAVVDRNQAIGTLHGLRSRLVLRAVGKRESNLRTVLIPDGDVVISRDSPHVRIDIRLSDADSLSFSQLQIDERLGQLISPDLESHIYKTYLHAITSFPERDTLTGRTGTEESLFGLSDPINLISVPLSERAQKWLKLIAGLSPRRTWYPAHLRLMRTDSFHPTLSRYAQRDTFFGMVDEIFQHNLKSTFLYENAPRPPSYSTQPADLLLLERSHHRNRRQYPAGSVGSRSFVVEDQPYYSRDQDLSQEQTTAAAMAALVQAWPSTFDVQSLKPLLQQWEQISGFKEDFEDMSLSKMLSEGLKQQFAPLFNLCRSPLVSKQRLVFVLSLLTFGQPHNASRLNILLALAISPALKDLAELEHNSYDLNEGHAIDHHDISLIVEWCKKEFTPILGRYKSYSDQLTAEKSQREQFERHLVEQRQKISTAARSSWPNDSFVLPPHDELDCFDCVTLQQLLDAQFAKWHKNHVFMFQLTAFDRGIATVNRPWSGPSIGNNVLHFYQIDHTRKQHTHFSLLETMLFVDVSDSDFSDYEPSLLDGDLTQTISSREHQQVRSVTDASRDSRELEGIIDDLNRGFGAVEKRHTQLLRESIAALDTKTAEVKTRFRIPRSQILSNKAAEVKNRISQLIARCRELLQPRSDAELGLNMAGLWPQVNEMNLLQLLTAQHRDRVPYPWRHVLISFAREVTAIQRVERIQRHLAVEDDFALQRELANRAHAAWSIEGHPDWLLLEVQNNLLIRPVQISVAYEIMKPDNGLVLLGMGEGKTSVILPMVVTALAKGSHLVRVVVLKPLANEMLRQLSRSLSGLCGRTVYYLPFSRSTSMKAQTPDQLLNLYQECCQKQGVLLSLPEHQNSFRLVGADRLSSGNTGLANNLIRVQKWLDCNARDILDESDELLKPGYELVYTDGEANLLSGAPDRWTIALEVLTLIAEVAVRLHEEHPTGIEYERRTEGSFPHVRVTSDAGARALTECLTQKVVEGRLSSLPLGHCDDGILKSLHSFLHDIDVDGETCQKITKHFQASAQLDVLYVVRGLISHHILTHAFRKRWLVNYGLDRSRCLSAVPYRAKSIPSPSAEFAQPEMMVTLTALSWLYTGLQRSDLRKCLLILLKSPDPSDEYSTWVRQSTLPDKYRNSSSINLDDASFLDDLYEQLKDNQAVIGFFLKYVVYPREAKEFQHKLSSSAWDLCADDGGKVTSGFSGTCDSRVPSTCFQKDLEDLRHSTAMTLTTLLRKDNRRYVYAASASGQRLCTEELLSLIVEQNPSPSVIIDVGAQILESNQDVAAKWLAMCTEKMAAVFFSANDEKMVLNRDGTVERFVSSIFKDEIKSCLVYLDEFHTRGTDFQFPDRFQAGVLLGPGLLKDSLAQACMRMRKLAVSQSVTFFAPPEVDNSIRALLKDPPVSLDSSHVLRWAINQSCQALKGQTMIWTLRGLLHSRRRVAAARHLTEDGRVRNSDKYLATIRERESRPVSEMYRAGDVLERKLPFELSAHEKDDKIMKELLLEWESTEATNLKVCGIEEEQEREVLHEIEQEREVQRPRKVYPATPQVCEELEHLIREGTVPQNSAGLCPAFEVLTKTKLASQYVRVDWPFHILVTPDYMETVRISTQDDFLRPVQWVLRAKRIKQPIIISAHEANVFLPIIRKSNHATLVLYQPRTGKSMAPFDCLAVYRVPKTQGDLGISPQTVAVLNLFAGQLYFTTFEHYQHLCEVIGLWDGVRPLPNSREVANDNYVSPSCREVNGWTGCTFKGSPVKMLKEFIGMRRLGIEWSHTQMGRVLSGRFLRKEEFEDGLVGGMTRLDMQGAGNGEVKSENWCEVA
ncbi:hypothetical protein EDD36DRAFT_432369 [Exophiala viscosa]|uniref:ubiquitinyl hydrolase 1 n=2 Tax=Exophiala viscosa TaxID=2486360 RepID=A0AAN6DZM5_9EURO|nr:hypothetical protein EDD36DRAFT_432369 [Exophiala viscosa]